jgi:hypothetical protein
MHPTVERSAGLDVHQATVMATVRISNAPGGRDAITETLGTMTGALVTLLGWLQAHGVTQVAMFINSKHSAIASRSRSPPDRLVRVMRADF